MERKDLPETLRISKESRVPLWFLDVVDCARCIASLMLYALVFFKTIEVFSVYQKCLKGCTVSPEIILTEGVTTLKHTEE